MSENNPEPSKLQTPVDALKEENEQLREFIHELASENPGWTRMSDWIDYAKTLLSKLKSIE